MLNKDLCFKCRGGTEVLVKRMDGEWMFGSCYCPKLVKDARNMFGYIGGMLLTRSVPPPNCPYLFEHGVAEGMESVNIDKVEDYAK